MISRSQLVRNTCSRIAETANDVVVDQAKLSETVDRWFNEGAHNYKVFQDYECHITDKAALIDYIFVLDSLNFCFWPSTGYEYDNLAMQLKNILLKDKDAFKPHNLIKLSLEQFKETFFQGNDFPLLDERHRILVDTGYVTIKHFNGDFANIIKSSQNSCQQLKLLEILTSYFCHFQDHAIYEGRQVYFYKRAQILIGDLFASGIVFEDIDQLTMFPDYRVPQILNHYGILRYSEPLTKVIHEKQVIEHGSKWEVELRAVTLWAVELIKKEFKEKFNKELLSIEVDWMLWQIGEKMKDEIVPHHRTMSIYY